MMTREGAVGFIESIVGLKMHEQAQKLCDLVNGVPETIPTAALMGCVTALSPLTKSERRRTLRAVATLLGFEPPRSLEE